MNGLKPSAHSKGRNCSRQSVRNWSMTMPTTRRGRPAEGAGWAAAVDRKAQRLKMAVIGLKRLIFTFNGIWGYGVRCRESVVFRPLSVEYGVPVLVYRFVAGTPYGIFHLYGCARVANLELFEGFGG